MSGVSLLPARSPLVLACKRRYVQRIRLFRRLLVRRPMSNELVRLRELLRRGTLDPEALLRGLASHSVDAKRWRSQRFKELREARDACLFAYGLGKLFNKEVSVVRGELEDYDFALRAKADGELLLAGVQLKELPPAKLNPTLTLPDLLHRLSRNNPTDAWLLIRLNQGGYIADASLDAPSLPYAEVWYLWANSPDGLSWCIYGDTKRQHPQRFDFSYPM